MKKIALLFTLAFVFCSSPAYAWFDYQSHRCIEPSKPLTDDKMEWDFFISDVEEYERCIKKYVDQTKEDIDEITQKANEAINDYNNFVRYMRY